MHCDTNDTMLQATKARNITGPSLIKNGSMASPPAASFGNNHTSCNHTDPLCGHFQAWGMTTKPSKPPAGEILATFDDKTPAVVANTVGKGLSIHFYFFPGTSYFYGYTANSTSHRGSGGRASQWTLSGLLYNLTTGAGMGGVIPPVTTSNMHVEAPLLQGPTGSVVTLLNWSPDDTNKIVIVDSGGCVGVFSVEGGERGAWCADGDASSGQDWGGEREATAGLG